MTTFTTEDRLAAQKVIQGTDEWKRIKLGHVSGSSIADVMAKGKSGEAITRKKYRTRIVAERLSNEIMESFSNSSMEWGVLQEPFARQAYEVSRETFVDKTGFWLHPTIKWLGVSPDGLVGDDGLVEIKCPNTTTHIDYLDADVVPTEYYKQIQCQLWVTNREWCDFVSYDPRLPERNRLFVKRLYRSNDTISDMEVEVKQFLSEVESLIEKLGGSNGNSSL